MSSAGDDLIAESQIPMIQSVTSGHATKLMSADSRFQSPGGCGLVSCGQKQNPECRVSAACSWWVSGETVESEYRIAEFKSPSPRSETLE